MRRIRDCFGELNNFIKLGRFNVAKRILEKSALSKKLAFNWWRDINNSNNRIKAVKESYLKRMLDTRVGRVFSALRLLKALPHRLEDMGVSAAHKFELGLRKFILNKLREAYQQFKLGSEEAEVLKKRAGTAIFKKS